MRQASIVIWVIDLTSSDEVVEALAARILPHTEGKKVILALNKTDLLTPEELDSKRRLLGSIDATRIYMSARHRINTQNLLQELLKAAALPAVRPNDIIVTNIRHFEALMNARDAINRVIEGLKSDISGDFLSQDIRICMHYIGEITGQISNDEILGNVFKNFCIGK
jgi:tRNA modification GTPase